MGLHPLLLEGQAVEIEALAPAARGRFRLVDQLIHVAQAQTGDYLGMRRHAQDRTQIVLVEDADPADADPFGARREPKVPHRADR